MKLMGMQKLDLLLRTPGAADLLREHFHLKMQDIYRLNQKWMYLAPDVLSKLGELDIVTADLENHRKVLAEERVCLEEQKNLAEHLRGEVENLSQERDRVWEENERLKEKAVMLKAQVAEKEGQIELYVNSTSWKLTAPLRKMMDKVRRDG